MTIFRNPYFSRCGTWLVAACVAVSVIASGCKKDEKKQVDVMFPFLEVFRVKCINKSDKPVNFVFEPQKPDKKNLAAPNQTIDIQDLPQWNTAADVVHFTWDVLDNGKKLATANVSLSGTQAMDPEGIGYELTFDGKIITMRKIPGFVPKGGGSG